MEQNNVARFRQFFVESGRYGDRVKHNINSHAGKRLLLVERNAQFFIGRQQLRIDFIETLGTVFHTFGWSSGDTLIDFRIIDVRPIGARHLTPDLKCPQTPFEQPFRLILFCRDKTNRIFGQAAGSVSDSISESSCIIRQWHGQLFLRHGLFKFQEVNDSELTRTAHQRQRHGFWSNRLGTRASLFSEIALTSAGIRSPMRSPQEKSEFARSDPSTDDESGGLPITAIAGATAAVASTFLTASITSATLI